MFKNKKFYLFMLVVVVFFGLLARMNFSVDTYLLLSSPKFKYLIEYIYAGRLITPLFFFIQGFLQIPHPVIYFSSYILAILLLSTSLYELNDVLDKYIKNKVLSIVISIAILITPFIIELWLFIETGIMMLSILASVKAYKHFDKYLEKKEKNYLRNSLIWMFVAIFSYQGTVALFISLCTISIVLNIKNKKDFIRSNIIMLLLYGIPTIINYLFILLFSRARVGGNFVLSRMFNNVVELTKQLINGFGLFPKGFTIIILLITLVIVLIYIYKNKNKNKVLLSVLYIILMIYFFNIATVIPQTGNRIAIYPRTCYSFFSLIGIILTVINKKSNTKVLVAFLIMMLSIELLTFTRIEINRYKVNEKDKEIILEIENMVQEHENKAGVKVNKLAIYNLDDSKKFYDNLDDRINVSAIKENPSGIAAYTYLTNRLLEYAEEDESVRNTYFNNVDTHDFSLDQVVIVDDTIHWYLY